MNTLQPDQSGYLPRLVRGFWWWIKSNCQSLRSLALDVPAYAWGYLHPFREHTKPSVPRLLLGELKGMTILRWQPPRFEVRVMDGMGEHYGYPRHTAHILIWWNRRGYAWGVEYTTNASDQIPRTQDVANTTDSPERLSASVLFVFGGPFRMSVMAGMMWPQWKPWLGEGLSNEAILVLSFESGKTKR
jgi:hypothetical protein